MKLIRYNVIKLTAVSLSLSKAGSLHQTGFDKLTLTTFLNCLLNYIALTKTGIKNTNA